MQGVALFCTARRACDKIAQGCRAAATLGQEGENAKNTPKGFRRLALHYGNHLRGRKTYVPHAQNADQKYPAHAVCGNRHTACAGYITVQPFQG